MDSDLYQIFNITVYVVFQYVFNNFPYLRVKPLESFSQLYDRMSQKTLDMCDHFFFIRSRSNNLTSTTDDRIENF